jgi:hypothetical protein
MSRDLFEVFGIKSQNADHECHKAKLPGAHGLSVVALFAYYKDMS